MKALLLLAGLALAGDVDQSSSIAKEAAAALQARDYARARDLAGRAVKLNAANAQAWNFLAIADIKTKRYAEAVADATEAVNLLPGGTAALQSRAWALNKVGEYKKGLADAETTLRRDPDNGFALSNQAFAKAGLGDRTSSLDALKKAAALDPRFKPRYEAAHRSQSIPDLLASFGDITLEETSRTVDAAKSDSLQDAAQNAISTGDDHLALEQALRAVEANPSNLRAYNLMAVAHQHLKDFATELEDAERGLRIDRRNVALLSSKATALNRMKRYQEALEAAEAVIAQSPDNYYGHYARAQSMWGLGRRDEMIQSLRRAADLNPRLYGKLQEVLQLPKASDASFLLPEENARNAPRPAPAGPASSWPMVAGGLLALAAAFGMLFSVSRNREGGITLKRRKRRKTAEPALLRGQYRTLRKIGEGGMGLVYEGKDVTLERRVAIKKMREEIRTDKDERQRFIKEAKLVAALHHPNIVDIYAVVEEEDDVYLVFEFISGKNLHETISEKGRFAYDEMLPVVKGIAAAVDFAHKHRVIHRDLKPSNIMVDDHGRAKVMDFGVARQAKDALSRLHTQTVVGTPPYMAPEQETGTIREESDVYALGVLVYEMLTGLQPFAGSGGGMYANKVAKVYAPISQAAQGLPEILDEVFARVFEPEPEKRYHSAGEFYAELENLA